MMGMKSFVEINNPYDGKWSKSVSKETTHVNSESAEQDSSLSKSEIEQDNHYVDNQHNMSSIEDNSNVDNNIGGAVDMTSVNSDKSETITEDKTVSQPLRRKLRSNNYAHNISNIDIIDNQDNVDNIENQHKDSMRQATARRGRPKVTDRETRSKNFNLLMKPSTFKELNRIAGLKQAETGERSSVTDLVNTILEDYIRIYQSK